MFLANRKCLTRRASCGNCSWSSVNITLYSVDINNTYLIMKKYVQTKELISIQLPSLDKGVYMELVFFTQSHLCDWLMIAKQVLMQQSRNSIVSSIDMEEVVKETIFYPAR